MRLLPTRPRLLALGEPTHGEVMERGFSHGWGAYGPNRELVRWMRAYNDGRPGAEGVRFAGFDGPLEITGAASPRQALTALHTYLAARGSTPRPPDTVEGLLYALPQERCLVDAGRLAAALADVVPAMRESSWYGYLVRLRPAGPGAPGGQRRDRVRQGHGCRQGRLISTGPGERPFRGAGNCAPSYNRPAAPPPPNPADA